jgi:hypothetical protein
MSPVMQVVKACRAAHSHNWANCGGSAGCALPLRPCAPLGVQFAIARNGGLESGRIGVITRVGVGRPEHCARFAGGADDRDADYLRATGHRASKSQRGRDIDIPVAIDSSPLQRGHEISAYSGSRLRTNSRPECSAEHETSSESFFGETCCQPAGNRRRA